MAFCENCGTKLEDGAVFCDACGAKNGAGDSGAASGGDDLKALWQKGTAYLQQGEFDKSLVALSKALQLVKSDRQKAACLNDRAYAYKGLGRIDDAVADLCEAINLKPENAGLRESRAEIYEAAGEYQKAIADCKKALELDSAMEDDEGEDGAKAILARCEAKVATGDI